MATSGRREEHRAMNLFYDQVYRLMIFLGALLLLAFSTQIYALKIEAKTDLAVRRRMTRHEEPVIGPDGREYYYSDYIPPTADDITKYYMHEVGPIRHVAGSFFTRFYRNTGWLPEFVNDIALRWLWFAIVVVILLVLRIVLRRRLTKLIAKQGRGEVDSLVIRNFKPLYHDRFINYLIVMAITIAGPVKHALFWPTVGAIYVILAEFWYFMKLLLKSNPADPRFAKKHWWVRVAMRFTTLTGWRTWRESGNPALRFVGKTLFTIAFVITWPINKIWRKVKNVFRMGEEEYDQRYEDSEGGE